MWFVDFLTCFVFSAFSLALICALYLFCVRKALDIGCLPKKDATRVPSRRRRVDAAPSQLPHAARTADDDNSAMGSWIARGTCYEALSALVLQPFGLLLRMRGGPGDRGVDLQGIWSLPTSAHAAATNVAVVAQCKNNEESQVGSAAVRDLASSVLLARERELQTSKQRCLPPQPVCGLFFSQTGYSKEAIR